MPKDDLFAHFYNLRCLEDWGGWDEMAVPGNQMELCEACERPGYACTCRVGKWLEDEDSDAPVEEAVLRSLAGKRPRTPEPEEEVEIDLASYFDERGVNRPDRIKFCRTYASHLDAQEKFKKSLKKTKKDH